MCGNGPCVAINLERLFEEEVCILTVITNVQIGWEGNSKGILVPKYYPSRSISIIVLGQKGK